MKQVCLVYLVYLVCLVYLVYLVCLVYLVYLVCLVYLVYLVCLVYLVLTLNKFALRMFCALQVYSREPACQFGRLYQ